MELKTSTKVGIGLFTTGLLFCAGALWWSILLLPGIVLILAAMIVWFGIETLF